MTHDFARDLAAVARIGAVEKILHVVCGTTGMGFAAIARVTEDRWVACAVRDEIAFGLLPGGELPIATTLCNEVRGRDELIVIDHVAQDAVYSDHHCPARYGFQSYISVPVRLRNGEFFGTLCSIDPRPARLNTPQIIGMFTLFAELISLQLDMHDQLDSSARDLRKEREDSVLRENFIAVLGHDLRNPLSAINASALALDRLATDSTSRKLVTMIQNSSARMAGLISNVLDFARGRLGGGLPISQGAVLDLERVLAHVIGELRAAWPDRRIESELNLHDPVICDSARISQLLSNLLANALTYGDPSKTVAVRARSGSSGFEISVINHGPPIAPETLRGLFEPFVRASSSAGREGLGLGLYIASEIARAHNGTLQATSTEQETRFTFHMPVAQTQRDRL